MKVFDEHKEIVKAMMKDPELKTLIKLVEASIDTPDLVSSMLNEIYFRAVTTVRAKRKDK